MRGYTALLITLLFASVLSHPWGPNFIPTDGVVNWMDFGTSTTDNVRSEYRSLSGEGNNIQHPEWGTVFSSYLRVQAPSAYYSGPVDPTDPESPLADPADSWDPTLPNPRFISHKLFEVGGKETPNDVLINQLHLNWAHFVTADIINTQHSPMIAIDNIEIEIPEEDWWHDESWGTGNPGDGSQPVPCESDPFISICKKTGEHSFIDQDRNLPFPGTGRGTGIPKEAYSDVTHWLDLSSIYGIPSVPQQFYGLWASNPYFDVVDGKLQNWGKFNFAEAGYDPSPFFFPGPAAEYIAAGDFRINKTPGLRVLGLTFMREHNRLVDEFRELHPTWSNVTLFHEARRMNIAFYQAITVREYLAAAVGKPAVPYTGYKPEVSPNMDSIFAFVSFRYGHSALPELMPLLDDELNFCPYGYKEYKDNFYPSMWSVPDYENPYFDPATGLETTRLRRKYDYESIIRGLSHSLAAKVDLNFVDAIRNFMIQVGGPRHGTDLITQDIFRSRDMGLPPYNDIREYLGLGRVKDFSEITANKAYQGMLKEIYGTVDRIDAYVGAMAEDHTTLEMGPFNRVSMLEQFTRLRDSDRFWYENPDYFTREEIELVQTTKLKDILARNWDISPDALPVNPFFMNERQLTAFRSATVFPRPQDHPKGLPWANINLTDVYHLYWAIDRSVEPREITVQIIVQTDGWAGIGFGPEARGTMKGADIVLCRIFEDVPECRDSRAFDVGQPILDTDSGGENNIWDVSVNRDNGILQAMFTRYMTNEADPEHDNEIGDNMRIIFAFNPYENDLVYHGPTRNPDTIIDFESSYRGPYMKKSINQGVVVLLYVLCAIGVTTALIYTGFVLSKKDYFRFQTPEFCVLVNFGAILGYISVLLILPDSQNDGTCKAHLWLFGMSFWIVFVGFFTKVARVYWIVKRTEKTMEVTVLPFYYLFAPLAAFMLAEMVMNICWDTLVPPNLSIEYDDDENTYVEYCAGNKWFWLGSVIWRACFLGLGVLLAIETKHLPQELNWSKEIGAAIYTMAIILAIGIPIGFFVSDASTMVIILKGLTICIAYLTVTFIVHSDSIVRIFTDKGPREQTRSHHGVSRTEARSTTSVSTA